MFRYLLSWTEFLRTCHELVACSGKQSADRSSRHPRPTHSMPVFLTSSKSSAECSLLGFKANEEIGTNGNHGSAFDFQLPISHWTLSCITLHWSFCDTVTVAIFWYPWEFMLFINQPGSSSMGALQWWWNDFKSVFPGAFWDPRRSTVSVLKFSAVIQLFPSPRFEVMMQQAGWPMWPRSFRQNWEREIRLQSTPCKNFKKLDSIEGSGTAAVAF